MKNYIALMKKIIKEGHEKNDTFSLFGETLEFNLAEGFPLITTRKMNFNLVSGELACFLKGYSDVREFQNLGVNFWDADCNKDSWVNSGKKVYKYDLGKIYGVQWKRGFGFDQIKTLVDNIKSNPSSRRHILITYNPADLDWGCLPPCYVSHQFYVGDGETLDMMVHQRSADFCLGVPVDIASFALFQTLMAKETGLKPGKLKIIYGDIHIYRAHLEGLSDHLTREPQDLPHLVLKNDTSILDFNPSDVYIRGYEPLERIKYPFVVQS